MPIKMLERQRRFRELGRIRMGEKVPVLDKTTGKQVVRNGQPLSRPGQLAQWRLTSAQGGLLAAAADVYGGEVRVWEDAPAGSTQYELYTEADSLDVAVPPLIDGAPIDSVCSQWMEAWSGGGCLRRCDGEYDVLNQAECVCPVNDHERMSELRGQKPGERVLRNGEHPDMRTTGPCSAHTRLSLLVYRLPDIGTWRLDTSSFFASIELGFAVELLAMANAKGSPQPAVLRIDQRHKLENGKRTPYPVAVLELPTMSSGMALGMGGNEAGAAALASPRPVAIEAPSVPALPAAPDPITALLDEIGKMDAAHKAHAKTIAAEFGCKLTPKALGEHAEFFDTLATWVEVGASLPHRNEPIDVPSAPIDESPEMTAPFDEPVSA